MSGSVVRDFVVFVAYCVGGYFALEATILILEQLPGWAIWASAFAVGGAIVWRFGPERDEELRLGDDGHLHSTLFDMRFRR